MLFLAADNPSLALPAADCVKIKPKWEKVRYHQLKGLYG